MILLDFPWMPLPGAARRLMAKAGLVCRPDASRYLDIDPREESIYQMNEAHWEWQALMDQWEAAGSTWLPAGTVAGVPHAAVHRGLLRQINGRLLVTFRFCRLVARLRPGQHRFIIAVPRALREGFRQSGIPVSEGWSQFVWTICRLALLLHALGALAVRSGRACRDGRTRLSGPAPETRRPIVWLGLSPAELSKVPGELNALDYVRGGRHPLFQEGCPLFLNAPWLRVSEARPDVHARLCPDPIREAPGVEFTVRDYLDLFVDTAAVARRIVADGFRHGGLLIVQARDYADLPRMRLWFRRVRPRAILLTNSMYGSHPMWLAYGPACGTEVVMLFYATNVLPLCFQGARDPVKGDPAYRLAECSTFDVWTQAQQQWLVSLGISADRVRIAGIIVWARDKQLDERRGPFRAPVDRPLRIGLFDVVPPNRSFYVEVGVGDHFYSNDRMVALLRDVVHASEQWPGLKPVVYVKSKRARMAIHDSRYFDALDELAEKGAVVLGGLPTNPVEAVAACDVVISAPFSSPTVIAAHMNIPACFYDPVGLLREHPGLPVEAPLVVGREALSRWLVQLNSGAV